jgi:hypothetical protein
LSLVRSQVLRFDATAETLADLQLRSPFLGVPMNVTIWLEQLGLAQYATAFRDNDIDGDVLPDLTGEDLIAIGVTSVGHRRKLVSAIAMVPASERWGVSGS